MPKSRALPLISPLATSPRGEVNLFQPLFFPLHNNHSLGVLINFLYEVVKAVNREGGGITELKIDAGLLRTFQSSV